MIIYLSPSNQPANRYVVGNTTEKIEMEQIAKLVAQELNLYNCKVKMATLSQPISYRYDEAKGCDLYLAIHSNAGSATARGAVAYYHPSSKESKELAEALVKELNSISKYGSNRWKQVQSGMDAFNGAGYGEVREPWKRHKIPPVLLEVDFHSNKDTARWIIDNKVDIALAIVNALVKKYGLKKTVPNTMYYVQVGAFRYKKNAEELRDKLIKDGYNVYIKQE